MPRKRGIVTRSQSISSENGPSASKKICLPLGDFSVLPLEIIEQILSRLPITSFSTLACTSREWMNFIDKLLNTNRSIRLITSKFSRMLFDPEKRWCSDFGDLIRTTTLLMNNGKATRLKWLQRILAELRLKWRSPEIKMRGFSAFLNHCFRSSDPEELDQVIEIVTKKIRMKTYIHTQLKYVRGVKKTHEMSTRQICRVLFKNDRILVAALKFFNKNGKFQRKMTTDDLARLIYVMSGPAITKKGIAQVGWIVASDLRSVPASSMKAVANFLNMSFWREAPFSIEAILKALLDNVDCVWSISAIGALMVNLDIDLAVSYLREQLACADILVDVGMHSLETMTKFLDRLKTVINVDSCQRLGIGMHSVVRKEIETQKIVCKETCGDCSNCPGCPMRDLEKIKTLIETFITPVPAPLRRSERLRTVQRKSYV